MAETFGAYLRQLRLSKGFSLRAFAKTIKWLPSNLSNLENNKINPPRDATMLLKIAKALELKENSAEWNTYYNLSANTPDRIPADLAEYANEVELMPQMFRTVANKKLSKEQIKKLIEDIKKM